MLIRLLFVGIFGFGAVSAEGGVLARFKMSPKLGGAIDVELFDQDKPVTVSNFVAYVKSGQWHDLIYHRWVRDFVLQGGSVRVPHDPTLLSPLSTARQSVLPGPTIPFERDVGRPFSNLFGTLAMARVGSDTNSASIDWFFNLKDNVNLDTQDGGYTVFARTLRGTNVLGRFNSPVTNLFVLGQNDPYPVYSEDGANGFWVNADITLLTAQITRASNANEISWESVEGLPNVIEFSPTLPAVWQELQTVTGTGARMSVPHAPTTDAAYYRVRIVYPANPT